MNKKRRITQNTLYMIYWTGGFQFEKSEWNLLLYMDIRTIMMKNKMFAARKLTEEMMGGDQSSSRKKDNHKNKRKPIVISDSSSLFSPSSSWSSSQQHKKTLNWKTGGKVDASSVVCVFDRVLGPPVSLFSSHSFQFNCDATVLMLEWNRCKYLFLSFSLSRFSSSCKQGMQGFTRRVLVVVDVAREWMSDSMEALSQILLTLLSFSDECPASRECKVWSGWARVRAH